MALLIDKLSGKIFGFSDNKIREVSNNQTPGRAFLNSSGELNDTTGWAIVEGSGKTLNSDSIQFYSGDNSLSVNGVSGTCAFGAKAIRVTPGQKYKIKIAIRSSAIVTTGLYLRLNEKSSYPTGDYVTQSNRTSITDLVSNGGIASANTWLLYEFIYNVPTGIYFVSPSVYSWTGIGAAQLWFDWLEFSTTFQTDITTTETIAGYTFGGLPIYMRRVTGTSPVAGGDINLFTPSTGTASRLIDYDGWIIRSGANQRHPMKTVNTLDNGHASMIYQVTTDGSIHLWHNNTAFSSQNYDIFIFYTK